MNRRVLLLGLVLLLPRPSAAQTIGLRLSSFTPPQHVMNAQVLAPWAEQIKAKTGGRVDITLFPGATLGKPEDQYDMAVQGVADITWGILSFTPGRFPLSSVMELPFMSPSAETGSRMISRLLAGGHLGDEYRDVRVLALGTPSNIDLHTSGRLVKTLEDLRGLRIRVLDPSMGMLLREWGATPVNVPTTELYLALERGVIDGLFTDPLTLYAIRANEVTCYHTRVGITTSPFFLAMNKAAWERLPAEAKEAFLELSGEKFSADMNGGMVDRLSAAAWQRLALKGHTTFDLPQAELARWRESAVAVYEQWERQVTARGLPAASTLAAARRLREDLAR